MKTDSDRRIAEKILQHASLKGKRVLEIGCGNGRITALLAGLPSSLTAIDPDAGQIRQARKSVAGVDFRVGSGENLDFPDACFDRVVFTLSLHHQNSRTAIREAARVLADRGRILVVEPENQGEVERLFAQLRCENQATVQAVNAICRSGLHIERWEAFEATWRFEDKQDLLRSVFAYYDMAFDAQVAGKISDLLGERLESRPITLVDTMVIHALQNPG